MIEHQKDYYNQNKDRINETKKIHYEKIKDKYIEYYKDYQNYNKDRLNEAL